jgi:hypothetical protein
LSETRRRQVNETVAPNVVIYQQFSNFQTFFGNKGISVTKKRNSGARANKSMGIKEILRSSKKNRPVSHLYSSIGSGPIVGKEFIKL